ncbi:MAG: GGDEF domain-containing protein [Rhodospirillaceae bacterium]|nr:GGDEF domain-containing protein [Rhodospirillaceae bacterium]|tara:strand:+ start:3852 stop:4601 length:750 start_codon:yes stop_codon:yes gene_type:complete
MKINPIGPVGTSKVTRVRRTSNSSSSKVADAYSTSKKDPVDDQVSIMGIPEAELTPKVREAIMSLMAEVAAMRKEIDATKNELANLAKLADRDSLLPVQNRRAFVRELTRSMARVERYGKPSSIVYIDVNDLKKINDNFGHVAGDEALKHVAKVLVDNVREIDQIGRLGGDEFCVILDEADTNSAKEKADELARAITDSPFIFDNQNLIVNVAVGVYTITGSEDVSQALAEADKDMYENKRQIKKNDQS